MSMAEYRVYGWITARVSTVVDADSEEEAYEKAEYEFNGVENYTGFGDFDHLIGVSGDEDTITCESLVDWSDCEIWEE